MYSDILLQRKRVEGRIEIYSMLSLFIFKLVIKYLKFIIASRFFISIMQILLSESYHTALESSL